MRAAMVFGLAFACAGCCAGCALETAPEEDTVEGPEGEATQEIGESFTQPIRLGMSMKSKEFKVLNQGVVTVEAKAHWDNPGRCKLPTYKIELIRTGYLGMRLGQGDRTYPAKGTAHSETWRGLGAGTYYLIVSSTNTDSYCTLLGSMSVSVGVLS